MAQFGHVDGRRKESMTGEDGRYLTTQIGHGDEKRKARLEKMVATAQISLGDRGRKKSKKWIGFDLD